MNRQKVIAGIAVGGLLLTAFAAAVIVLAGAAIQTTVKQEVQPAVDRIGPQLADLSKRIDEQGDRVTTLPDDGQTWSTVFVWSSDKLSNPADRALASRFASTPELRSLLSQTYVYEYTQDHKLWAERYSKTMNGETPQLWVQRPLASNNDYADVVYKVSGRNIPATGKQLAAEIQKNIDAKTLGGGPCPQPFKPKPGPEIKPPAETPIPDIRPPPEDVQPEEDGVPAWALLIPLGIVVVFGPVLLIGLGLCGAWLAWKNK